MIGNIKKKMLSLINRGSDNELTYEVAYLQGIGARKRQEDSYYISNPKMISEKGLLLVVSDGMGGLEDGDVMSRLVAQTSKAFFDEFSVSKYVNNQYVGPAMLRDLLSCIQRTAQMMTIDKEENYCGATMVAVYVYEGKLSFLSVGDSRIYLLRDEKLIQLNREHNQDMQLIEAMSNKTISKSEYDDIRNKKAITSFIGIDDLTEYDISYIPIRLYKEDRIMLMSDGVFGYIKEIGIMSSYSDSCDEFVASIGRKITEMNNLKQDNYTSIIMGVKG